MHMVDFSDLHKLIQSCHKNSCFEVKNALKTAPIDCMVTLPVRIPSLNHNTHRMLKLYPLIAMLIPATMHSLMRLAQHSVEHVFEIFAWKCVTFCVCEWIWWPSKWICLRLQSLDFCKKTGFKFRARTYLSNDIKFRLTYTVARNWVEWKINRKTTAIQTAS